MMRLEQFLIRKKWRFVAFCRCEFCGTVVMRDGYDFEIFQFVQVQKMECPTCGRASDDDQLLQNPQQLGGK